jgi:hypothetical protein
MAAKLVESTSSGRPKQIGTSQTPPAPEPSPLDDSRVQSLTCAATEVGHKTLHSQTAHGTTKKHKWHVPGERAPIMLRCICPEDNKPRQRSENGKPRGTNQGQMLPPFTFARTFIAQVIQNHGHHSDKNTR